MSSQLLGLLAAAIAGGAILSNSMKITRQGDQALVEFLGKYEGKKLQPGLTFLTPFIEYVACKETLREQIMNIPLTECTTSDRKIVTVDFVVYWRIMDLEKSYYKVQDLRRSMLNLLLGLIRTQIAMMELDELYTARAEINEKLVAELDVVTEPWGVKITRVEMRDFTIGSKNPAGGNNIFKKGM